MNDRQPRIRVLVENEALTGLGAEHGVAYLVQADGKKGLFDTGASDLILQNAERLGEDLSDLDWIALSHGHNDHTGGLSAVLGIQTKRVTLYAHSEAFNNKFSVSDGDYHAIGITLPRNEIERRADIVIADRALNISDHVILTGEIPRHVPYETANPHFVTDDSGRDTVDPMRDDISLILNTPKGHAVIFGCGHAGPVNILNHVKHLTGADKFALVAGGMHLGSVSDERIQKTVVAFKKFGVERVAPVHCSGERAFQTFQAAFGAHAIPFPAGTLMEL